MAIDSFFSFMYAGYIHIKEVVSRCPSLGVFLETPCSNVEEFHHHSFRIFSSEQSHILARTRSPSTYFVSTEVRVLWPTWRWRGGQQRLLETLAAPFPLPFYPILYSILHFSLLWLQCLNWNVFRFAEQILRFNQWRRQSSEGLQAE